MQEIVVLLLSRNREKRDKAIESLEKEIPAGKSIDWAMPHLIDAYITEWFDPGRIRIVVKRVIKKGLKRVRS